MTSTVPAGVLSSRTHLTEHCTNCDNGVANGPPDGQWVICKECGGSTRRLRGTHDPRSAIDHDPEAEKRIEALLPSRRPSSFDRVGETLTRDRRMRELARTLRDASNSAPLRELLDLIEPQPKEEP